MNEGITYISPVFSNMYGILRMILSGGLDWDAMLLRVEYILWIRVGDVVRDAITGNSNSISQVNGID